MCLRSLTNNSALHTYVYMPDYLRRM
jgi:hypothetical protein